MTSHQRELVLVPLSGCARPVLRGCSQPYQSQYGRPELQLIADAAHRAGIPVTAHAHANPGTADTVAAGVDGIEHCFFRTKQGVSLDLQTVAALARPAYL